jgi:molybdenum cofactor synthesis domain-containing protein
VGDTRTAAALIIGNELLSGKVTDCNLVCLARTLRGVGVRLLRVVMVPDSRDVIAAEVRELSARHDLVFTSGGVGPTHDDLTVDAVADAFGVPVVCSPELERLLRDHFRDRLNAVHLRFARVPAGARLVGQAGLPWPTAVMANVWLLPGVPQIFSAQMACVAAELAGGPTFCSLALCTTLDEGVIKPWLDEVVAAHPDVEVGSYPRWHHPRYRTKVTFDGTDAAAIERARSALLARLPAEALVEADE